MKRAAVFAHYDRDNIIDDYVIYYLKELKEIVEELVFVSCNELPDTEKSKLNGIADFVIAEKHDEYDFGSYKRGYFYIKPHLKDFDELIFANDSCFGPLYPLREIFDEMETAETCDFWGITKNRFGLTKSQSGYKTVRRPHIQSYFLVLKKTVFTSKTFDEFMESIRHHDEKNEIVLNYEIGLYEKLTAAGFSSCAYIKNLYRFNHILISFWRLLIERYNMPFVKCSVLRLQNETLTTTDKWQECISSNTSYPVSLIEENLKRTSSRKKSLKFIPASLKILYFYFIGIQPAFAKRYFTKFNHFLVRIGTAIFGT